jgi:hypothetical protein
MLIQVVVPQDDIFVLPEPAKASSLDCVLQFGASHCFLILLVFASIIAMLVARSLAEDDSTDLPDSKDWKSGF